ncbi:MAG: CDP-alcohol phosphatidyltransferase family protein, partial [Coriobacteriales bacterium]|jgi:phosphatidylglycerophosphate synthase
LDPIADKMTLVFSFLSLMIWYKLPRWFGVIYITKELLQLTGGLVLIKKKRKIIPSNYWGKTSTFLFFVGLFLFSIDLEGTGIHGLSLIILSLGLFLSLVAFFTYSRNILKK